jgi:hypothetical protein
LQHTQHARCDARAAHACYTKKMIDGHVHLDADQYPDPSGAIKRRARYFESESKINHS